MKLHCERVEASLGTGPDMADITSLLQGVVRRSGIRQGVAHCMAVGSTGSLTAIEWEPGVVEDLKGAIRRMAPPDMDYAHDRAWGDGNGHSHVQAALVGPSLSISVREGKLKLGTWQQAVLVNHDTRSRRRVAEVTVIGEG